MHLARLADTMTVSGCITNADGSQDIALIIPLKRLDAIRSSSATSDIMASTSLLYTVGLEPNTEEGFIPTSSISATTDLSAIAYPEEDAIIYMDGYGKGFLFDGEPLCILRDALLSEMGIELGDNIEISMYTPTYAEYGGYTFVYDYYASATLRVIGSFTTAHKFSLSDRVDMVMPFDWARSMESGVSFYAGSVKFTVDASELNAFKEEMLEASFAESDMQKVYDREGVALQISDEGYIKAASQIGQTLSLLKAFLPLVFLITAALGFIVSYLLMQNRQLDFAIMRSLGMTNAKTFLIHMLETVGVELLGCLAGAMIFFRVSQNGIQWSMLLLFLAVFCLGTAFALWMLGRFSVMTALTKAE